jgi:archaellum component FlaC
MVTDNIDNIVSEYLKNGNDFGFSSVDETEYESSIQDKDDSIEGLKKRLKDVERLVMPLLSNLYKTADQKYIKWENRGPEIKNLMDKVLKATRG